MATLRGCEFPEDRYYHPEHNVWAQRGPDGLATIGATSFAVALAVEFCAFVPKPSGTLVARDRSFGVIELAKTLVAAKAPVTGTIEAVNEAVIARPELINTDPYGAGWLVKLRPARWEDDAATLVTGPAIGPAFERMMALENFDGARG